ncbi:hypothetical protein [Falsiroseomonas selenitidurans]|uniref:Invasion associated locus B family protein n=1 Tax=Falsiroseomonas selenitidurans TaxID=2716335 RepID=A0ABX1E604_9PROT|nr:hypothetical protein [Falsiroseomonas selenitidurans]NKC32604.1 hypothetical protein [Falsiroseomonas selenitidurans]
MNRTLIALMLAASPALAQPATQIQGQVPEEIGSWRLSCLNDRMTDQAACLLRHAVPVEPAGGTGSSLLLEIQDRDGSLVPVVTARDLGLENARSGLLAVTGTAQLRFPPNRHFDLPCSLEGRSLVCAPRPEDTARASQELANAPTALVRMTGLGAGSNLAEPAELALSRTRDAMARYRSRIPEGSTPPRPGLTLPDILGRLQGLFR